MAGFALKPWIIESPEVLAHFQKYVDSATPSEVQIIARMLTLYPLVDSGNPAGVEWSFPGWHEWALDMLETLPASDINRVKGLLVRRSPDLPRVFRILSERMDEEPDNATDYLPSVSYAGGFSLDESSIYLWLQVFAKYARSLNCALRYRIAQELVWLRNYSFDFDAVQRVLIQAGFDVPASLTGEDAFDRLREMRDEQCP